MQRRYRAKYGKIVAVPCRNTIYRQYTITTGDLSTKTGESSKRVRTDGNVDATVALFETEPHTSIRRALLQLGISCIFIQRTLNAIPSI